MSTKSPAWHRHHLLPTPRAPKCSSTHHCLPAAVNTNTHTQAGSKNNQAPHGMAHSSSPSPGSLSHTSGGTWRWGGRRQGAAGPSCALSTLSHKSRVPSLQEASIVCPSPQGSPTTCSNSPSPSLGACRAGQTSWTIQPVNDSPFSSLPQTETGGHLFQAWVLGARQERVKSDPSSPNSQTRPSIFRRLNHRGLQTWG